ncbi:hypothetical protein LPAF129_20180 [Ligilactobacillus pabuli]|uniref:DUF1659 domain-containing protein n=1 Tax=Ligilactobacillus pabuli TaxID=2886039 RepID=A0ABQ5JJU0_9LACO|nr:hypothetical protein [Ligilactobacillus pabuli]GKS82332.1 hypothetical protein LPAF129_20180 [Ligilactobacillus pabuli]
MSEMWSKTNLAVKSTKEDGQQRKRNFNNIAQDATDEKLAAFGQLVEQLTGEATEELSVNVTTSLV